MAAKLAFSDRPWTPPGPKKGQKGPFRGYTREKRDRRARSQQNFGRSGFLHKRPSSVVSPSGLRLFPKTRFGPGTPQNGPESRFCFKGTKLPFRCNSLRRSTPAGSQWLKGPVGTFRPLWASQDIYLPFVLKNLVLPFKCTFV